MRIKAFLMIALLSSIATESFASDGAKQLLTSMAANAKTLNYKGFFTYERAASSRSFKLYHMVDDGLEKQRLIYLEGEAFEVINDGHSLSCVHPGETAIHAEGLANISPVTDLNQSGIWQYYDAIMLEDTRVAAREAKRVYLKPKDQNRYAYVFAIDAEKQVLLKMQLIDAQGRSLERFRVVDIEFDTVTVADIQPENEQGFKHLVHAHPDKKEQVVSRLWHVAWLPDGFIEESAQVHSSHTQTVDEQHMFSDGLSTFSVFIEKTAVNTPQNAEKRHGGTVAVSRFVVEQAQQYRVTVVGEIPVSSAKLIAQSVTLMK